MLGKISGVRHAVVLGSIGATTALTGAGVIGAGGVTFDAWQVAVEPIGDDGLRVTYVIDEDFKSNQKHGYEGFIANDLGIPTDFEVSSPDAPDMFSIDQVYEPEGEVTRIRIGDPDQTITGQHRYEVSYTYPNAKLASGVISLDLANAMDHPVTSFDALITGFEINDPTCLAGETDSTDTCEVSSGPDGYRMHVDDLPEGGGVTFEGDIVQRVAPSEFVVNPPPERREDNRGELMGAMAGLGLLGAVPTYLYARRVGRNEVYAGGAAEAAFGELPPPATDSSAASAKSNRAPTRLVLDAEMPDLATTEFVPPKDIAPWQAQVLLAERFDQETVKAWFSGLAGSEFINLSEDGKKLVIASGPRRDQLESPDRELLDQVLAISDPYVAGKYNAGFARAWEAIAASQRNRIAASGWWKRFPPGGSGGGANLVRTLLGMWPLWFAGFVALSSAGASFAGFLNSPWLALALGLGLPALVAYIMYRQLMPARTARGSAYALQTESFRRFLHASEGQHVEWAYQHNLLREYSGWAVALNEAEAWSNALDRANVPAPARAQAMPLYMYTRFGSVTQARMAPQSSGGRSGGGFRSGRVGGGGGGMRGGSW